MTLNRPLSSSMGVREKEVGASGGASVTDQPKSAVVINQLTKYSQHTLATQLNVHLDWGKFHIHFGRKLHSVQQEQQNIQVCSVSKCSVNLHTLTRRCCYNSECWNNFRCIHLPKNVVKVFYEALVYMVRMSNCYLTILNSSKTTESRLLWTYTVLSAAFFSPQCTPENTLSHLWTQTYLV